MVGDECVRYIELGRKVRVIWEADGCKSEHKKACQVF